MTHVDGCGHEVQRRIISLGTLLKPRRAVGAEKMRLGGEHDGGYVTVDDFSDVGIALSLGGGDDVSWDLALADRHIRVMQYDHTVERAPLDHPNFAFHPIKVVADGADGDTLTSLVERHGGDDHGRLILKCDIEGDEWGVLDGASDAALSKFSQIICEFHDFGHVADDEWYLRALRVLRKLRRQFTVVHVHANNFGRLRTIGNVPFPDLLEVTFVHESRFTFVDTDEVFPTPCDAANRADRPDIVLGPFDVSAWQSRSPDEPLISRLDHVPREDLAEFLGGSLEDRELRAELIARTGTLERVSGDLVARTDELVATRAELIARTDMLERVARDLAARTDELVATRAELVARTDMLERVSGDLVARTEDLVTSRSDLSSRTDELVATRAELVARTDMLERVSGDLVARTDELVASRSDLSSRTDELVATRSELVARTDILERVSGDLVARTEELVASRSDLSGRTDELAATRAELIARTDELVATRVAHAEKAAALDRALAAARDHRRG